MEVLANNQEQSMNFDQLVLGIQHLDSTLRDSTVRAINRMTTIRNWLIGAYIVEYEQNGADRAKYGAKLIETLSMRLGKGFPVVALRKSRTFYKEYPQIVNYIQIQPTLSVKLLKTIQPTLSVESIDVSQPFNGQKGYINDAETLISKLSFSHFVELLSVADPLVRYFYELECIKNTWSVRELRRQIATNLHVRISLTEEKLALMAKVNEATEKNSTALQIRDPYTFEFLGLRPQDIGEESDLEEALIKHLEDFILELGKGFCFEARQKRILIDDEYYFADLVFYNRLLHCSVIIEVKNDEFHHENLGQLNAYVGYYAENEMQPGDNPPVGILLCTKKGKKMVEYALGAMDRQLFVSTYQLQLPNREQLEDFIEQQRKEGFQ